MDACSRIVGHNDELTVLLALFGFALFLQRQYSTGEAREMDHITASTTTLVRREGRLELRLCLISSTFAEYLGCSICMPSSGWMCSTKFVSDNTDLRLLDAESGV